MNSIIYIGLCVIMWARDGGCLIIIWRHYTSNGYIEEKSYT